MFTGSKLVDDNYVIQASETEVKPVDGLYTPITWNGNTWVGTDQDVWKKAQDTYWEAYYKEHPDEKPKPDPTAEALAQITLSAAQNKADQDAVNAQLLLATAQQTAKETN